MTVCLFDIEDDFTQGGNVQGDFGENRCRWDWDADTNSITVGNNLYSRTLTLAGRNPHEIPADDALERIAAVVRDTYEDLQRNPPLRPES